MILAAIIPSRKKRSQRPLRARVRRSIVLDEYTFGKLDKAQIEGSHDVILKIAAQNRNNKPTKDMVDNVYPGIHIGNSVFILNVPPQDRSAHYYCRQFFGALDQFQLVDV